jgi:hypothetical protein
MLNLSQFIIGLIFNQIQQFVSVLCKKKIDSKILTLFLKLGNSINRFFIISSIGISFFSLIKDRFGSRVIVYLIKTIKEKNFFSLINYKIFNLLSYKYSCQVLEFFFQNIKNEQQKHFTTIFLILCNEIKYSKFAYKFYNKFYSLRAFFSGFSFKLRNKLNLLYIHKVFVLKKNFFNYSPFFSSYILFELFRFGYKLKNNSLFVKIIFQYIFFLSNSFKGLLLISHTLRLFDIKKSNFFFKKIVSILPNLLKNKYGHILILFIFQYFIFKRQYSELSNFTDKILNLKNQNFQYSEYIYLYFLNPFCKIFYKKKKYKIIQKIYEKNEIMKPNKNDEINLYYLLNYNLKFKDLKNSHLITRHLVKKIRLSKNKKKLYFFRYFDKNKSKKKKKKLKFKKFQNIFYFLNHIANNKQMINSELFLFYLFDYSFNNFLSKQYIELINLKIFRCLFFSMKYKVNTLIQNKNIFLKIILPIKKEIQEDAIYLLHLDRLIDI